ncbi:MAG: prepilin-type N-terminal cleavage/methylation domain-containing protein [Betaproteobacteria bacterium]|jgi:MSHA pilin protein MshA|nr:prepilin-type N-terminal cleavage/methylation domain-containing protein [Betaproteobacteria bacterium]
MRARQQSGFTLVELVVVIVILGILAATAIPRYAAYSQQAKISALNGVAGAIRSAVLVVQGRYISTGATASPIAMLDGTTVAVSIAATSPGIPTAAAAGIGNAVVANGFAAAAGGGGWQWDFVPAQANCNVVYTTPGAAPFFAVTVTTTGCT